MTTPSENPPQRPDIAQELLQRANAAEEGRITPIPRIEEAAKAKIASMRHTDRANAQVLQRIVSVYGWPGRSLVGAEASQAALSIALHADHDPPFQRVLLRMLHTAAKRGDATAAQWAHLYDRCLAHEQKLQLYGTQHRFGPDGQLEPLPISDPEGLDDRRAKIGLPPYAEQAERLRQRHRGESSLSPPGRGRALLPGEQCPA